MVALHTAKSEWVHLFSLKNADIIDRTLIQIKKFTYLRFNFYDPDRKNDKLQFIKQYFITLVYYRSCEKKFFY